MRFIPKKKEILTEADINPLEVNSVDLTYDEQYVQAIMRAVASESSAIVEYEQILAIEPHVTSENLVNIFHDTLEDIKNEEIKHISQLNTKLAEAPSLKDGYKDGEEEAESGVDKENESEENNEETKQEESTEDLTEAVEEGRYYEPARVMDALSDRFDLNDEQFDDISKIIDIYGNNDELTAEEMDKALQNVITKYQFSEEEIPTLEDIVNSTIDPRADRRENFKDDIAFDVDTLEGIIDQLDTFAAKQRVQKIIEELNNLEYNGEKNIGWNANHFDPKKHTGGYIS